METAEMSSHEPNLHLKEEVVTCKISIRQNDLDGLNALIHYLSGIEKHAGVGRIPGTFELIIHYRMLIAAIKQHYDNQKTT